MDSKYFEKYIKYKKKYLLQKKINQIGSGIEEKNTEQMMELIEKRFNNQYEQIIGGGGNGIVLKVKDSNDGKFKAYKITKSELSEETEAAINFLQDTKFGIGLTKLYEVYNCFPWRFTNFVIISELLEKEENKKFAKYLFFQPNYTLDEMNELIENDPDIKKIYPKQYGHDEEYTSELSHQIWSAQIMELLDSDVEKLMKTGKKTTDFDNMFLCVIRNIFELVFGINCIDSNKANNKFIKKISIGEEINGVDLLNYDFWKLKLGGEDYYFPRQDYIVKFGDYDEWNINYSLRNILYTYNAESNKDILNDKENISENIQNLLNLPLAESNDQNARRVGFEKNDGKFKLTKTVKWFDLDINKYEKYKIEPDSSKTVFSFF